MLLRNPSLRQTADPNWIGGPEGVAQAFHAIRSAHGASDPCVLLASLFQATRAFGVRESAYAHVIPDPERPTRVMVMLACNPMHAFAHKQFGAPLDHPWLNYAREHAEPTLASSLHGSDSLDDRYRQLQRHFDSVFIVPTHSGGNTGRFGALLFDTASATESGIDLPLCRLLAHSLAHEMHDWWVRRTRAELQVAARLRSDDVKLLEYERQELSTKQIARLLDTTLTAIDSRFQRINAKIGTSHRRHAAMRAAIHGLI